MKNLLLILAAGSVISCIPQSKELNTKNVTLHNLNQQEVETELNLPPEPNPKINNSTILGVDSNNNEIRDDWERAIAFEFYNDTTLRNLHNKSAINSKRLTVAYQTNNKLAYQSLAEESKEIDDCAIYFYGKDAGLRASKIANMAENTKERLSHIMKRDLAIAKEVKLSSRQLAPYEQKKVCSKYKVSTFTNKINTKRIEIEFNLPPEPNLEENNSTILGIDSNNNEIRDDWERAIVFEFYDDQIALNLYKQYAKNSTQLTKAFENENKAKYKSLKDDKLEITSCMGYYDKQNSLGVENIIKMEENTRQRLFHIVERDAGSYLGSSPKNELSENKLKSICPKFNNYNLK